jgi:hypothetical protein
MLLRRGLVSPSGFLAPRESVAYRRPILRAADRRSPLGLSPSYGFPLVHG